MRQVNFPEVKGHLDSSNVFEFFGGHQQKTDFGIVDYFATKGYEPMRNMSYLGKAKRVFLPTKEFEWSYPKAKKEFYIVEDLSGTDKPGIGGGKFRLKFNTKKVDNLYYITPDPQLPLSLLVTEDEIVRDGDGYIFWVRVVGENINERYFPKELLAPGTKYFFTGTADSEYNQTLSSLPELDGGVRKFFSVVGQDGQQLNYSITREAAVTEITGRSGLINYDQFLQTIQTFEFKPDTLGYNLTMLTPEAQMSFNGDITAMYRQNYGANAEKKMAADSLLNLWAPKVEMLGMKLLAQWVNTQAYYSPGGTVMIDGVNETQKSLGLFHQYMLGNTSDYNLGNVSLEFLETLVISRLQGKMQYSPDQVGPEIVLKTGKGGLALVNDLLSKRPGQMGQVILADPYLKNTGGDNRNVYFAEPFYRSWISKSGIRFRVDWEPSLDPETANNLINPIVPVQSGIGGNRLSSYIFIVEDLTANDTANGESNVYELLPPDWELRQSYINGKMAYPGTEDATGKWQRQPGVAGFQVIMELRNKAFWLKDPTKSLVIKPKNPFTGKAIFDYR